jgi:hypothetical protein
MSHPPVDLRWLFPIRPPGIRAGRWLLGGALLLAGLAFFWALDVFHQQVNVGAALFFCTLVAYIVPVFGYISDRTIAALDALSDDLNAATAQVQDWRRGIYRKSGTWLAIVLTIGVGSGIVHNAVLYWFGTLDWGQLLTAPGFAIAMGTLTIWVVMTIVITALIDNAIMLARAARSCRVDLLNTTRLRPFATVAVISTLAIIGAQAAFPIMTLGGDTEWVAYIPGLLATGIPMVMLAAMPVWPLHRRIADARRQALAEADHRIAALGKPDPAAPQSLQPLAPLLTYRRELREVSEWPFDFGVLTRLGLYLIIPPFTWVGAALIENVVNAFL